MDLCEMFQTCTAVGPKKNLIVAFLNNHTKNPLLENQFNVETWYALNFVIQNNNIEAGGFQ